MKKTLFLILLVMFAGSWLKHHLHAPSAGPSTTGSMSPALDYKAGSVLAPEARQIDQVALAAQRAISAPRRTVGLSPGSPGTDSTDGGVVPASPVGSSAVGSAQVGSLTKPAKFGNLSVPPGLMRFMTPSLLTTAPSETQRLTPADRQILRQITAQARANPAAFREQLGVIAKTSRSAQ